MVGTILYILYGVLTVAFAVMAWRLSRAYRQFSMKHLVSGRSLVDDLPSVTVCIPARNEMHAMTECLERVIASTYPKLEVIVLDDLSGDDTPSLIKAFAHDGVRFVEGTTLPDGWLGKNHALQELLQEASGSLVLFMDVDTIIAPDTIEQLVAYAAQEGALMVSVLPRRDDGLRASVLFSTLRYFWELVFHRKEAPATASSAWLVHRRTLLEKWHGFDAFKTAIQPESKIAAGLMTTDQYRFLISTPLLGVSYQKKWHSQVETSIRLLFPLLGARLAHSFFGVLDLLLLASPLFISLSGFFVGWGIHQLIAGIILALFMALYGSYLAKVRTRGWLMGAVLWPFIILQEAVLLIISAVRYKRHTITWKGRVVRFERS